MVSDARIPQTRTPWSLMTMSHHVGSRTVLGGKDDLLCSAQRFIPNSLKKRAQAQRVLAGGYRRWFCYRNVHKASTEDVARGSHCTMILLLFSNFHSAGIFGRIVIEIPLGGTAVRAEMQLSVCLGQNV